MKESAPIYCPRCGKAVPLPEHQDPATMLNDDGELVPDYGDLLPGNLFTDWVEVAGFLVCSDCATHDEVCAMHGTCVRCGREDEEGEDRWVAPGICPKCQTHGEVRTDTLNYLNLVAEAIAGTRASEDWDRARDLEQPWSWETAVSIMQERAVPNHLHRRDPINPFLSDDEMQPCWDTVSSDLQDEILRCSGLLCKARYAIPDEIPGGGYPLEEAPDWWLGVDWWQIERTIRRYVREARNAAQAEAGGTR